MLQIKDSPCTLEPETTGHARGAELHMHHLLTPSTAPTFKVVPRKIHDMNHLMQTHCAMVATSILLATPPNTTLGKLNGKVKKLLIKLRLCPTSIKRRIGS